VNSHDFDRFVAEGIDGLVRTAYLIVGDMHDAEDLVQETLFKVARRWPKVSRMDYPVAYARRILVNLALRGGPKRSRRRFELSETRPGDPAAPAAPLDRHDELSGSRGCSRTAVLPRHRQEHGFSWTCATRTDAAPDQRRKEDRIMNQLETELRAALHERAARVHASPGLLAADYQRRTRRMRPSVAIGGGVAAAVALALTSGARSAFAGWTPRPTAPTPGQLAAAEAYCAENLPFPGLPLKLIDTRGPFTFVVYSDGSSNDFCTTGPPSFANASGWRTSPPVTVPAGKLYLWEEHTTTDAGQAYTSMIAQAGDGVSAANPTLEDGTEVTATVSNGWAVAWWPGSHQVTSAQLTTPSGTQTQMFPLSPCGLHNCAGGGPHGGAPGGGPGGG
jgi:DNA-directed RNA polymerase specialized sigma24 family protein